MHWRNDWLLSSVGTIRQSWYMDAVSFIALPVNVKDVFRLQTKSSSSYMAHTQRSSNSCLAYRKINHYSIEYIFFSLQEFCDKFNLESDLETQSETIVFNSQWRPSNVLRLRLFLSWNRSLYASFAHFVHFFLQLHTWNASLKLTFRVKIHYHRDL